MEDKLAAYASGLVFGRFITLWPSFHKPRFLRKSTRSKRLRTLRLAAMVLEERTLRCWDIKGFLGLRGN